MAFQFLPLGFKVGQPINFNTLNLNSLSFNKLNSDGYDYGWGDVPAGGFTGEGIAEQAKVAAENGNTTGAKILSAIATYGPILFTLLEQIGVAKKTASGGIEVNNDTARDVINGTGGKLDPPSVSVYTNSNPTEERSAKILGIPVSTAVIIIGIALLYFIFKDEIRNAGHKRLRNKGYFKR